VIPTHFKSKLPHTLSWPIGAEAITTGLGDVPHAAECCLSFYFPSDGEFRRVLREFQPYRVFFIYYRPEDRPPLGRARDIDAVGGYDAKWQIDIAPVLRERRAEVGSLLREQGLPAIAGWLRSFRGNSWQGQFHRMDLIYSPAVRTLSQKFADGY
jgi:hypothetical protein